MYLFPAISLTDSTPFTFQRNVQASVMGTVKHLIAWVDSGSSTVYCGNVPGPNVTIEELACVNGSNVIGRNTANPHGVFRRLKLGYQWTTVDGSDDGNMIVGIDDNLLLFREAFTVSLDGLSVEFVPPPVNATNGLPILEGTERQWTNERDSDFLSNPIKFVVDTGATATLRIAYED